MPTIHVHTSSGKHLVYPARTRDAGSLRTLYADLEARMAACLRYTLSGRTGDSNEVGHAFHGNQHTGGISGPQKTKEQHVAHVQSQKLKSAKVAVHALLSSGHPFTKAELAAAVGMDPNGKTINDYLTNLKNPKFAGPQGALKIEKNAQGMFYVAMPNGSIAPPPDTKVDWSQQQAGNVSMEKVASPPPALPPHLQKVVAKLEPSHTVTEVHVKGFTEPPVEVPHVPEVQAIQAAQVEEANALMKLKNAHPGSMPKGEADKHYQAHLEAAFDTLENQVSEQPQHAAAHVLAFKQAKVDGMSAWAQAVHGQPFVSKPQQMFKADVALAEELIKQNGAMSQAWHLDKWKANTLAEKAGNFPPKPKPAANVTMTPVAHAVPVTPPPVQVITDMGTPAAVEAIDYDALVPASHQPIAEGDILDGHFHTGIENFKSILMKQSGVNAQANKKDVEYSLRDRLKDKPNFQALVKRLALSKDGYGSLESRLIAAWAGSSGDSNDISVAQQIAVKDAFSIPDKHVEKKALQSLKAHGSEDAVIAAGIHSLNQNMKKLQPHEIPVARAALKEFVLAQYHETQDLLKSHGLDHVYLARGMKTKTTSQNALGAANLKLQPASSFSTNYATAKAFGGTGTVFLSKVPREQVLSTYMSGFGCTTEHEVVVLAHDKLKAYTVPAPGYDSPGSSSAAQNWVKAEIETHKHTISQPGYVPPAPPPKGAKSVKGATAKLSLAKGHAYGTVPVSKNAITKAAQEATKKGDVHALKNLLYTSNFTGKPKTKQYVEKLVELHGG